MWEQPSSSTPACCSPTPIRSTRREVAHAQQRRGRLEHDPHRDGGLEALARAPQLEPLLEQELAHAPQVGAVAHERHGDAHVGAMSGERDRLELAPQDVRLPEESADPCATRSWVDWSSTHVTPMNVPFGATR